ncbi:MAG: hypothetical protein QHC88_16745 [Achromobacter sp.]|uniref:hypothetical protein n=1 Tax=Achromobacter sp. TaxID=134375 RepID=UPI0029B58D54|nr:hypothetical protein [Achromobacter sp.]MDX3986898.1 hypothetical protein [Achromobacter sp.]
MKHLTEDTIRAVLVAVVHQNGSDIEGAITSAMAALVSAEKSLDAYDKGESWKDAKAQVVFQMPYPPVTDYQTVRAMLVNGDMFIKTLAAAWDLADANNRKRIRTTWADEFRKYATVVHYQEMARQAEREGRN